MAVEQLLVLLRTETGERGSEYYIYIYNFILEFYIRILYLYNVISFTRELGLAAGGGGSKRSAETVCVCVCVCVCV